MYMYMFVYSVYAYVFENENEIVFVHVIENVHMCMHMCVFVTFHNGFIFLLLVAVSDTLLQLSSNISPKLI